MASINLLGKIFRKGDCWGVVPEAQIYGPSQVLKSQYLFGNSPLPDQFKEEGMPVFIAGNVTNSSASCVDLGGDWLQIDEIADTRPLESKVAGPAFSNGIIVGAVAVGVIFSILYVARRPNAKRDR